MKGMKKQDMPNGSKARSYMVWGQRRSKMDCGFEDEARSKSATYAADEKFDIGMHMYG